MLDVKALLTKILEKVAEPPIGSAEAVTFPFTATKSGLCIAIITPPTSSTSYIYIAEDGTAYWRGASSGGLQYSMVIPITKGKTYTIQASSNYNFNGGVKFCAIMGG